MTIMGNTLDIPETACSLSTIQGAFYGRGCSEVLVFGPPFIRFCPTDERTLACSRRVFKMGLSS
jgi:hypothetical protein